MVLIPVYLVYLNIIIFLIQNIFLGSKKLSQIFLIILTILTVKLARISEFGYDYLSNIILLKIVLLYLVNEFDKKNNILFKNFLFNFIFICSFDKNYCVIFYSNFNLFFISDFLKNK